MIVKAWLDGDRFDLEILAELLPTGDTRVVLEDDGCYLTAAEIDNRPAGVPFYDVAPKVLQLVNGLARVHSSGYRPVRLSGRYQEGEMQHQVVQAGVAECRTRVMPATLVIDGQPVESAPPSGPAHAARAGSDPDVAEALGIMARPDSPNWDGLYKVHEIIESTGRLDAAMKEAGISKSQIGLFTRTANHQAASGADARHARLKVDPPKKPMPLAKAREMIGDLVRAWMDLPKQ